MPGAAIAGGVIGLAGGIYSGISAKSQADAQAGILRQQAASERQIAGLNAEDFKRSTSRLMAKRRAAGGATGIEQGSGSALAVSEDLAAEAEFQRLRILAGGEVRGTRLEQSAALSKRAGQNALIGGFLRGSGSLLSGISDSKFV